MRVRAVLAATLLLALACTNPIVDSAFDSEEPDPGPEPVKLLLVVDNSSSMSEESGELAMLLDPLLEDGSEAWLTTTTAGDGLLVEGTTDADTLRLGLLCEATCWNASTIPSDPSYECGGGLEEITLQYLDCECGFEAWEGNCGSGDEEPLEAVAQVSASMGLSEPVHVVVFTDEGDSSRQLSQGEDSAQLYLDAYASAGFEPVFSVLGPDYQASAGTLECNNGGATTWGVAGLQHAVESTGGVYAPIAITGSGGDCETGDIEGFIEQLVELR